MIRRCGCKKRRAKAPARNIKVRGVVPKRGANKLSQIRINAKGNMVGPRKRKTV